MDRPTNSPQREPFKFRFKHVMLIVLFVIFFGPLIAAWSLYENGNKTVFETLNYGHLIESPITVNTMPVYKEDGKTYSMRKLHGKWLMMYVTPVPCDEACLKNLYNMRQVRKALGKNMNRVERVIVTYPDRDAKSLDNFIRRDYYGTIHLLAKRDELAKFLAPLPSSKMAMSKGTLYLVDPLGNIMMSYKPDSPPKGVLKDLSRLLKASRIG